MKNRLTEEIQYWDYRAVELAQKERAGKNNIKLNSAMAKRSAEELQQRLSKRLNEIETERKILPQPPVVTGGVLVIPKGLLHQLMGTDSEGEQKEAQNKKAVELAAMNAVMKIEQKQGFVPNDVSKENRGYDIESKIPDAEKRHLNHSLRMIEVKGRAKGSVTVTVTRNEILTALNVEEDEKEFILALVEVDGDSTRTVYLQNPFHNTPEFATNSINYDISDLIQSSNIIYQE